MNINENNLKLSDQYDSKNEKNIDNLIITNSDLNMSPAERMYKRHLQNVMNYQKKNPEKIKEKNKRNNEKLKNLKYENPEKYQEMLQKKREYYQNVTKPKLLELKNEKIKEKLN